MKQKEKQRQLKQRFTKKNIAILSTAITVCIVAAIAIPLCVLSVQTLPVSNALPQGQHVRQVIPLQDHSLTISAAL